MLTDAPKPRPRRREFLNFEDYLTAARLWHKEQTEWTAPENAAETTEEAEG